MLTSLGITKSPTATARQQIAAIFSLSASLLVNPVSAQVTSRVTIGEVHRQSTHQPADEPPVGTFRQEVNQQCTRKSTKTRQQIRTKRNLKRSGSRWILHSLLPNQQVGIGNHFAAISGAGPLIGPVLGGAVWLSTWDVAAQRVTLGAI